MNALSVSRLQAEDRAGRWRAIYLGEWNKRNKVIRLVVLVVE